MLSPPDPQLLRLRVLDLDLAIEGDDAALLEFIGELWSPFVSLEQGSPQIACSIRSSEAGWLFETDEHGPHPIGDPWLVALELRGLIDSLTISSVPGAIDLHAAGAVVADRVLLFPGDPGIGKTTLVMAGLKRGWTLVCDDLALLDIRTGTVRVLPRPIGIRSGVSLAAFEDRWAPPAWVPPPRSAFLVPAGAFGYSKEREVAIDGVVFPSYKPESPTVLSPLGVAQALAMMARHVKPLEAPVMGCLSAICSRATIATLDYGEPSVGARLVTETFEGSSG